MIVSIGMLAYNEAARIGKTIASLMAQSAFHASDGATSDIEWEIVVVPNGCIDDTALVADEALRSGIATLDGASVEHSIKVLAQGGKSNAWNHFVHEMSRRDADVIVMIDADIEFGHPDTLRNCLAELQHNPLAKVVVDLPLKDFERKAKLSLRESISARSSTMQLLGDVGLSGQFYCASASTLRDVWMPEGLSGEDGFLKGMIITDLFRREPDFRRVARAANASHYYEGLTDLRSILRHELRMVIGTTLNCYFMWDFLKFATDPSGPGATTLIRNQLAADPTWYRRTVENQIRNRGLFVLPRGMLFRRFAPLRGLPWRQAVKQMPLILAGTLLDIPTYWAANRRLRSGRAFGFW